MKPNEPSQTLPRGEKYQDKIAAEEGTSSEEEERYRRTGRLPRAPVNEDSHLKDSFIHSFILYLIYLSLPHA